MMPLDLRKSCSLGVFGLVAIENSDSSDLISFVTGDLRNYKGKNRNFGTIEAIKNVLKK
jgi:hypothetical protein